MKNPLRYLGFLGFFSLLGLRWFQTNEWPYLLFFGWVLWFVWFIPSFSKRARMKGAGDERERERGGEGEGERGRGE